MNTKRVIVGVSGSLGNLSALHAAAAEARRLAAPLVAVHAWQPAGGEVAYRRAPCPPLLQLQQDDEREVLHTAFVDAFGEIPGDLVVDALPVRGSPGPTLVRLAHRAGDLLVVGAGQPGWIRRLWHGAVSRYCLAHATCPTLVIPQPELTRELRRPLLQRRAYSSALFSDALRPS